jgi:DNA mismatch repair protein MutS
VLDRTATSMGSRTLRAWLLAPLREPSAIDERLDAVEELARDEAAGRSLLASLDRVGDLERRLGRIVMASAGPRDLLATAESLARIPELKSRLAAASAPLLGRLADDLDPLPELRSDLERAIAEDTPALARDGGVIRDGWSAPLDELRSLSRSAREHLARLESSERERTGIGSLKVRHNKVFGYYLEVTQTHLAKVPPDWQRRQTVANGERYTTEDLRALESRILSAQDKSLALEADLFEEMRAKVAGHADALRRTARALGAADALAALASAATAHGYVRPKVDGGTALVIRGGRHPVVERIAAATTLPGLGDGRFVPNDTDLDCAERQIVVLTGPNMGGKSTYLRQVALITLMAQAGSFVPAESARIGVVDRIFTRVGASDHLAAGQSTFMVEMTETARILHEATSRSLVVLDEIGRGTSTFDGLSIAWAVAEYLHETPRVAARTLFATHYHELTGLCALYPRVRNLRMATREWKGDIVFLHRVEEGVGDRSYGIQVARLAGIPGPVISRAREVLENLQRAEIDPTGAPRLARHEAEDGRAKLPKSRAPQLPLFGEDPRLREVADRLASIDVDGLSPRAALDLLAELRAAAKR